MNGERVPNFANEGIRLRKLRRDKLDGPSHRKERKRQLYRCQQDNEDFFGRRGKTGKEWINHGGTENTEEKREGSKFLQKLTKKTKGSVASDRKKEGKKISTEANEGSERTCFKTKAGGLLNFALFALFVSFVSFCKNFQGFNAASRGTQRLGLRL